MEPCSQLCTTCWVDEVCIVQRGGSFMVIILTKLPEGCFTPAPPPYLNSEAKLPQIVKSLGCFLV